MKEGVCGHEQRGERASERLYETKAQAQLIKRQTCKQHKPEPGYRSLDSPYQAGLCVSVRVLGGIRATTTNNFSFIRSPTFPTNPPPLLLPHVLLPLLTSTLVHPRPPL